MFAPKGITFSSVWVWTVRSLTKFLKIYRQWTGKSHEHARTWARQKIRHKTNDSTFHYSTYLTDTISNRIQPFSTWFVWFLLCLSAGIFVSHLLQSKQKHFTLEFLHRRWVVNSFAHILTYNGDSFTVYTYEYLMRMFRWVRSNSLLRLRNPGPFDGLFVLFGVVPLRCRIYWYEQNTIQIKLTDNKNEVSSKMVCAFVHAIGDGFGFSIDNRLYAELLNVMKTSTIGCAELTDSTMSCIYHLRFIVQKY